MVLHLTPPAPPPPQGDLRPTSLTFERAGSKSQSWEKKKNLPGQVRSVYSPQKQRRINANKGSIRAREKGWRGVADLEHVDSVGVLKSQPLQEGVPPRHAVRSKSTYLHEYHEPGVHSRCYENPKGDKSLGKSRMSTLPPSKMPGGEQDVHVDVSSW